jgi:hypothetical protein
MPALSLGLFGCVFLAWDPKRRWAEPANFRFPHTAISLEELHRLPQREAQHREP